VMTRWLITGAGGMLGSDLCRHLAGREVLPLAHTDLDITDPAAVTAAIMDARPDVVVNCAAWTDVDAAEGNEAAAFDVNGTSAANIARSCAAIGTKLVHVSTDYVFDGAATSPYAEDAALRPRSAYGRTKAAGEWAVRAILPHRSWIARTAWLYGAHGPNFVKTMIRLEATRDEIEVVIDQRGQPTWTVDVAEAIVRLLDAGATPGVYHATSAGETTWFEFARTIFGALGADPHRVRPITSDRFPRPAARPAYSVLSHDAWMRESLPCLPDWRSSFALAFPRIMAQHVR
jgi:dTDP-4-dehydrorhamnose reductase